MGSLGQGSSLASEKPLSQMRMCGLDMTRQDTPGAYFLHLRQSLGRGLAGLSSKQTLDGLDDILTCLGQFVVLSFAPTIIYDNIGVAEQGKVVT